jgi:hypothetical protein
MVIACLSIVDLIIHTRTYEFDDPWVEYFELNINLDGLGYLVKLMTLERNTFGMHLVFSEIILSLFFVDTEINLPCKTGSFRHRSVHR